MGLLYLFTRSILPHISTLTDHHHHHHHQGEQLMTSTTGKPTERVKTNVTEKNTSMPGKI
jgi:hypothetical protein